jgi:arylsulfatase A-like enzyme
MPLHGTSMRYFFDDPAAPERRQTQYFEIMCNRGIYHRGWTAVPAGTHAGARAGRPGTGRTRA